jgi:hypothetical protein
MKDGTIVRTLPSMVIKKTDFSIERHWTKICHNDNMEKYSVQVKPTCL